jgi:hypothetical protein
MKRTLAILLTTAATLAVSSAAQATTISGFPGFADHEVFDVFGGATPNYAHSLTNFDGAKTGSIVGKSTALTGATLTGRVLGVGPSAKISSTRGDGELDLASGVAGTAEATFTLSQPAHYFGFSFESDNGLFGVTGANTITLFGTSGQILGTLSAEQLEALGSKNKDGSYYANITSNLPIGSIAFDSTGVGAKFEIDDVSVSSVPVPAALPLFGAAIAGLGVMSKRRRRKAAQSV